MADGARSCFWQWRDEIPWLRLRDLLVLNYPISYGQVYDVVYRRCDMSLERYVVFDICSANFETERKSAIVCSLLHSSAVVPALNRIVIPWVSF
jgi:hypothetical protein